MPSLNEALTAFLSVGRAPLTNLSYRRILQPMVNDVGPGRNIRRITYQDLIDYLARYRKAHVIADTTAHTYSVAIKALFSWCARQGMIKTSPAQGINIYVPPLPPELPAIPYHELQKMIDYVRNNPRNLAILYFLADTGCRSGGLASLTLDHLYLDDTTALLREKGGKWEYVYFGYETAEVLRNWLTIRGKIKHNFVFTTTGESAHPFTSQAIGQIVRNIAKHAGCNEIYSPHDIRRRVGEALNDMGLSIHLTQQKLNHSRLDTTARHYASRGNSRLRDLSRRYALAALQPTFTADQEPPPISKIIAFPRLG